MGTKFKTEEFTWDGMYLMYRGEFPGAPLMNEVHPDCHPSWIGKVKPNFIARFKYGAKPWKSWVKCITENYTVEDYLKISSEESPLAAVQRVGYSGKGRYTKRRNF